MVTNKLKFKVPTAWVYPEIVETILSLPFAEEIKSISLTAKVVDGSLHYPHCRQGTSNYYPAISLRGKKEVVVSDISSRVVTLGALEAVLNCSSCKGGALRNLPVNRSNLNALSAAKLFATSYQSVHNMRKMGSKVTSSTVQNRLDTLKNLQTQLEEHPALTDEYPILKAHMQMLQVDMEETKRILVAASTNSDLRDKLLKQVGEGLIPLKFRNKGIKLDDDSKLIGIWPNPLKGYVKPQVKAIISGLVVCEGASLVLEGPAYLQVYLAKELCQGTNRNQVLILSAPAPKNKAVRETAASLWNPGEEATFACLHKAIEAAEKLL